MPILPTLMALTRDELARSIRQGFSRDSSYVWLLMVFVLGLGLAMIWLYWRNRTVYTSDSQAPAPLHLFNELSRELAVPLMDRWLLIRIAKEQALPTPITLLVSPRTLRHHATAFAETFTPRRRLRLLHRVSRLRRTLFGS